MKVIIILLASLSLSISAFSQKLVKTYWDSYNTKIQSEYYENANGIANGAVKRYFYDGGIFMQGTFKDNYPIGKWTEYYPSGKIHKIKTYTTPGYADFTVRDGKVISYYEDGKTIEREGNIKDGEYDGEYKEYNKDGTLTTEGKYVNGVLERTGESKRIYGEQQAAPLANGWTKTNLDVSTYRNGDSIPQVQDQVAWAKLTTGAWCYTNNDPSNGTKYGKLYNWYAVIDPRGLAPKGYHIPTDKEWTTLTQSVGAENLAGGKMKATGTQDWYGPNTGATNESGFSGLPGGIRKYNDEKDNFYRRSYGYWWSSDYAVSRKLDYLSAYIIRETMDMRDGLSVRCVKSDEQQVLKEEEALRMKKDESNKTIQEADKAYEVKDYKKALELYQSASFWLWNEKYPKDRIFEIIEKFQINSKFISDFGKSEYNTFAKDFNTLKADFKTKSVKAYSTATSTYNEQTPIGFNSCSCVEPWNEKNAENAIGCFEKNKEFYEPYQRAITETFFKYKAALEKEKENANKLDVIVKFENNEYKFTTYEKTTFLNNLKVAKDNFELSKSFKTNYLKAIESKTNITNLNGQNKKNTLFKKYLIVYTDLIAKINAYPGLVEATVLLKSLNAVSDKVVGLYSEETKDLEKKLKDAEASEQIQTIIVGQ